MSKELPILRHSLSPAQGVRIHHGSVGNAIGFHFLGVRTRQGFRFIQLRPGSGAGVFVARWPERNSGESRQARLRLLSPVLRRALAAAAQNARPRQVRGRRERLLEQLAALLLTWSCRRDAPSSDLRPRRAPLRWGR